MSKPQQIPVLACGKIGELCRNPKMEKCREHADWHDCVGDYAEAVLNKPDSVQELPEPLQDALMQVRAQHPFEVALGRVPSNIRLARLAFDLCLVSTYGYNEAIVEHHGSDPTKLSEDDLIRIVSGRADLTRTIAMNALSECLAERCLTIDRIVVAADKADEELDEVSLAADLIGTPAA